MISIELQKGSDSIEDVYEKFKTIGFCDDTVNGLNSHVTDRAFSVIIDS